MPPWYYRNLVNITGDFKREDYAVADYNPYGVAAFHFTPQPPAIGLASGTLSNAITFCSGTTYALTFDARNAAYLSQSCTLTVSLQNSGLINTYPATSFSDCFRDFGPVTFRPVRFAQNGEPTNADGTYNDVLDFSIRCVGVAGQALPSEGLFEVDRVSVVVNVSPIP
ncbi:MAG: hypothetical protein M1835_006230 [Candelina submexicana]|nr:MAG: hypothetical protein M1835_006230 [Candelina submexicana]